MLMPDTSFDNLYLHVPFCQAKCAYCAFYSKTAVHAGEMESWLNKMDRQLLMYAPQLQHLNTVYIGGGTPTFLPETVLQKFLSMIRERTAFCGKPSISIE